MKSVIKYSVLLLVCGILLFLIISLVVPPLFQKQGNRQSPPPSLRESESERVRCIDDNQEALLWRLRVIEEAEHELIFTTFSYQDDEAGSDMMAAVLHAAERGVHVRMVVDGFSGFTSMSHSKLFRALADAPNVEIRFYNPVSFLKPWRINYRMHDKYLVADDTVYMLGGRNTKNLSIGNYQAEKDIDRDMVVYTVEPEEGRSLEQVRAYFEQIWDLPTTKPFGAGKQPDEACLQTLRERYVYLENAYPEAFEETDWQQATMAARGVTLLHNPIEAGNKEPTLWADLIKLMGQGKDILIQTPYIMCNRYMYEDLYHLDDHGSTIQVLTNAVESGANVFGCADYLNEKEHIQSIGAVTYEYLGENSSHAKTVLVDQNLSFVGSFNCDMRSAYLDTELMLAIDCPELNAQLRETAETAMRQSRKVLADGTEIRGPECPDLTMPTGKKIVYGILRFVILPMRHLL